MILIAAYKSEAYGRFAYNLALSIKDKANLPICLVTDGKTGIDTSIFDEVVLIETPKDPCLFKIKLNEITPFKKTLYLDADMVCMNDISQLIEHVQAFKFWVDTLRDNESFWLKPEAFEREYQDTNTSIFYWESGKESYYYFKLLNYYYEEFDQAMYKAMWGKFIPDESLHSLVLSEMGIKFEHKSPIFYCDHSKPKQEIVKHYFLSMYGARIAKRNSLDIYDEQMKSVYKRASLEYTDRIDQLYRHKFIAN